jgi:hypothetical protein
MEPATYGKKQFQLIKHKEIHHRRLAAEMWTKTMHIKGRPGKKDSTGRAETDVADGGATRRNMPCHRNVIFVDIVFLQFRPLSPGSRDRQG